jgi:RNA polymerase sigma factor (sigma-70 family)
MLNAKQIEAAALKLLPAMSGMYRQLCATETEAEDALHDGYIYLVTYCLPEYRGGSTVRTFALQSLRRRFYSDSKSHYKTRRFRFKVQKDSEEAQGMDSLADQRSPTAYARVVEAQCLANALEALTGDERALCEAYLAHGKWSLAAEEIGVSKVKASRMLRSIQGKVSR